MPNLINADNGVVSGFAGVRTTADGTGNLALQSNGVTLMTLATNNTVTISGTTSQTGNASFGNVSTTGSIGAGTSNPGAKLDVVGNVLLSGQSTADQFIRIGSGRTGDGYSYLDIQGDTTYAAGLRLIRLNSGANSASSVEHSGIGALQLVTQQAAPIDFYTSATQRMRIDTSGNLLVGTTTSGGVGFTVATDAAGRILTSNVSAVPFDVYLFKNNGTTVGKITINTSSTSFTTSSDYRLKENIAPMIGALDKVQALKPVTYQWKSDNSVSQGFIAHELQAVIPECVVGEKDAVNEDGSIKAQGIDTSFLVATLTAALQELNAKVDAQAAEIAALKAGK